MPSESPDPGGIVPLVAGIAWALMMFEPSHSTLLAAGGVGLSIGGGLVTQYAVRSDFRERMALEGP